MAGGRRRGRDPPLELTTELGDYWRVLAAHHPQRALALIAEFAGQETVAPEAVYDGCDPFAAGVTADEREAGFGRAMLDPGRSPYNDGATAICCMVHPSNTLHSLLALAYAATTPRVMRDVASGRLRCLTCDEAVPLLSGAAQHGRASDPVLVERLGRLAYEGRLVAFDDPLGVYIQSVEHTRLRTPDGEPVPRDWFTFSRGFGAGAARDGRARYQRLVFEPPADCALRVDELVDAATELPIRYGGQIADLVQLAVFLRVSDRDARAVELPKPTRLAEASSDPSDCETVRRAHASFARHVS